MVTQKTKRTKKSPEMLDYRTVKRLLWTLRGAGLIHERLNQSAEILNKLYKRLCTRVDENLVFLAVQEVYKEKTGLVTHQSLLEKLSHEEINYAVAWQMIRIVPGLDLPGLNLFGWVCRQDRDGWCQARRVRGLLEFISKEFEGRIKEALGYVPLQDVFKRVEESGKFPAYTRKDIAQELISLRLIHKIRLITTKRMLAQNLGIELFEINGINYGFLKIEEELL